MFIKNMGIIITILLTISFAAVAFGCAGPQSSPTSSPTPTISASLGNLQVNVIDTSNNPLVGAKVVSQTQPDGQLKFTGLTYSEGTVNFNGIEAGQYDFTISQFNSLPRDVEVNVIAGQTTKITVTLDSAPGSTNTASPTPG